MTLLYLKLSEYDLSSLPHAAGDLRTSEESDLAWPHSTPSKLRQVEDVDSSFLLPRRPIPPPPLRLTIPNHQQKMSLRRAQCLQDNSSRDSVI